MPERAVRIVTEAELRGAVPLDLAAIDVVEHAFAALAGDGVVMPPVMSMDLPLVNGEVDVKTAYLPGFDGFAIKVSPGFFDNPKLGLPSLNGLMILFSARTALVETVFLDNGYLTDLRTAAAGAVAARHLAPETVQTAGVLGTGVQARMQIAAAHLVRPFERVLVWGRHRGRAEACAAEIAETLGVVARAVADPAEVVRDSQLVVTTTPARQPILQADWLHPGLHITAMGSDQSEKNELAPEALAAADLYVCDRVTQCATMGELRAARAAGLMAADPVELGQIVTGAAQGRTDAQQITICDLTGTGAQDTAIATHARALAEAAGAGQAIPV
ncbi:cyclodeaminase [Maritalea mobilis]|uniref:cyclodeaminase n=1 Tax=Maritalea mobilis TaxID=483324 RepID=UPI001C9898AF|nr:cyclodeaminase [Maritalea mobilis]MBY6199766.1 cyclodeaminase [Maritalea mobilis]